MELEKESKEVRQVVKNVFKDWAKDNRIENVLLISKIYGNWNVTGSSGNKNLSQMLEEHSDEIKENDTCYITDLNQPEVILKYRKFENRGMYA